MRRHNARVVALAVLASACAGGSMPMPGLAKTNVAPIVRTCASDRLPREILDGRIAAPKAPLHTVDLVAPAARLRLAVAATEHDREFGLMCVTRLLPQHGMIFVFSVDHEQEFWMKNTLVPLDMVWVKGNGEVTTIAANVPAVTLATPEAVLPRRRGVGTYVIELAAGEASADGITVGSRLVVPALEAAR